MDPDEILRSDSISDEILELNKSPDSNMFYTRRGSAIDRFTDPENITNYLCGYSIRVCTLYILWIHVTFMLCSFVLLILGATYIRIHFEIFHQTNETSYTVKANTHELFSVDTYSTGLDFDFGEVGYRILEVLLSLAFVDICVTLLALIGVYRNTLYLIIPYLISILLNINWLVCLMILEMILMISNLIDRHWIGYMILCILLTRDFYRFFVLYSYYRLYGKKITTPIIRTPQYLTTELPMNPVGFDLEEIPTKKMDRTDSKEKK